MKRPINYVAWAVGVVSTLGIAGALAKAGPYILPIVQNRNAWAAISLIGILMFTSGHMFNQIRKVPYVAGDGRGGISYFSTGFQNQLGMETQIIAFICTFAPEISSVPVSTNIYRWPFVVRFNRPDHEGSKSGRCQEAASVGSALVRRSVPRLQLPALHLPHQKRRLPVLAAPFHVRDR